MQSGQQIIELPGWSPKGYDLGQVQGWAADAMANGQPWMREVGDVLMRLLQNDESFQATTSGSTGLPRKIDLSREAMRASASATLSYFALTREHRLHLCLPAGRIGGTMVLVRALEGGLRLTLGPPGQNIASQLLHSGADLVSLTPHQCSVLLNDLEGRNNSSETFHLPTLLLGGAPVSHHLEHRLLQTGIAAFLGYGMTETVSHIALRKLNGSGDPYRTLPGIRVWAADDGTLVICAPQLGLPELQTTDLCRVLDAEHFHWLGRSDFAINSGGIKIHPESLEQQIAHLIPGNFAISALPDDQLGEKCVLVLESNEPPLGTDANELLNKLKQVVPRHHGPRDIVAVIRFPLTSGGKLDRKALRLEIGKK